jgi:DNA-directed RNA polymerase II subunit RPB2
MFDEDEYNDDEQERVVDDDAIEGNEAWQEACWAVISAYFDEKGLVRQQLDSFDEFVQMIVQKLLKIHHLLNCKLKFNIIKLN